MRLLTPLALSLALIGCTRTTEDTGDSGSDLTDVVDSDGDGVADDLDAFPDDPAEHTDSDGDGTGDNADAFPDDPAEDTDTDTDGIGDNADNCLNAANADQADADADGVGDICEGDRDSDGVIDDDDAFPDDPEETTDTDADGVGDNGDAFPDDPAETTDTDADGVGDNGDNCVSAPNTDQGDLDGDGAGDACDPDADGDGVNGGTVPGSDCDDLNAAVAPGVLEACDDLDNDCSGIADDGMASGSEAACAEATCLDVLTAYSDAESGDYYLSPPQHTGDAFLAYCDMETDGGGWTLTFYKNSKHNGAIYKADFKFGSDYGQVAALSGDPAPASAIAFADERVGWLDMNAFKTVSTHLRMSGWADGVETSSSDPIKTADLRLDFGNNGYFLWDVAPDPAREDGKTYYWCGGDAAYTDAGVGQVDPPSGAPADCKGHGSLGAGWDFSRENGGNRGFTLCGAEGASSWMHHTWGLTYVSYPNGGAAQGIWMR